ncbi:Uma2 family endonuclease [Micromonospora auratinigra]|uniref:Endonuclease, Uma2 family (Restriction endonuclease fold) n=1 Tax=Micromonospora auratinigra TaxID=261654 RepID=A0A1A8ZZM1_9ACTN|nr:Uma2 family endonuclease [Micromonospora auratinigra]SBT49288.1 Endonuclease, Uma2 family (restriction endonuclease fold) [Micromonospora auratinigra]
MAMPHKFDPLYDLDGMWTTQLADRYLPLPELPNARYECIDGRLVMTPAETGTNSYAEGELLHLLKPGAKAAGYYVYGQVNLTFSPDRWIQPDLTVLHAVPETEWEDRWIPVQLCTMVVEFVSPGSRRQDFVDKPRRCAEAGVPYFMRVQLVRRLRHVEVEFLTLDDGGYVSTARAVSGQRLKLDLPFPIDFDPVELLP